MGKTKRMTYGVAFFWFVVVMVVVGMIIAAIGAARDFAEDWGDA